MNNLKQMGIAMHGIAGRNNGVLPNSVGVFPDFTAKKPNATIFYHMLSDIFAVRPFVRQGEHNADELRLEREPVRSRFRLESFLSVRL
jgi:hypothetical protein